MQIELDKSKLPDNLEALKKYTIELGEELNESNKKILFLEEKINLLTMRIYGRKSEKTDSNDFTPDLFNRFILDELNENNAKPEGRSVRVKEHERKYSGRKGIDPNLPVDEVITHDLSSEEKKCPHCDRERPYLSYDYSRQMDIIPQKRKIIEHRIMKYGPCNCEESKLAEEPEVVCAKMPERIIPGSMLAEGALANIIAAKFCDGMPFYRQAKALTRAGINITRQMMCDDAIAISNKCSNLLSLLFEQFKTCLSINMDETHIKVVTEENKSVNGKSYMWVMRGLTRELKKIAYFHYDPSRAGTIPNELLEGFSGYLQTDGLSSYNACVENKGLKHAGCNAHSRRMFDEAYKAGKSLKNPKIALAFYRRIYKIEKELREKLNKKEIDEKRFEETRREQVIPYFDKLKKWLNKVRNEVLPQSLTGKAINYTLKEWDKLIKYLEVWYLTPDNNAAENTIRPFVVGRKNWLFAYSPEGARANACFYTLIQCALLNGLNPYHYLRYLFIKLPHAKTRADLEKLLPFNLSNEEIMKI